MMMDQFAVAAQARARLNQPGQPVVDDPDAQAQKAEVEAQALEQGQEAEHAAQRHLRQLQAEDEDDLSLYRKRTARRLAAGWGALEDSSDLGEPS